MNKKRESRQETPDIPMSDTPLTDDFVKEKNKRHLAAGYDDLEHYMRGVGEFAEFTRALERQILAARAELAAKEEHMLGALETDRHLLAAWTPDYYVGASPPYINLTMLRMKGDVVLTVRLPPEIGKPEGAVACVRFTRETWRQFIDTAKQANKVYEAADYLDSIAL